MNFHEILAALEVVKRIRGSIVWVQLVYAELVENWLLLNLAGERGTSVIAH